MTIALVEDGELERAAQLLKVTSYDLKEALALAYSDRPATDPSTIEYHTPNEAENSPCTCKPKKGFRHYTIAGQVVCSVSQIVGVVDKSGPLQWFAARETRKGILELLEGKRSIASLIRAQHAHRERKGYKQVPDELALHYVMQWKHLTYQDRTNDAADRGTTIHKMGEDWALYGKIPNPLDVKEEWRGWVRAYCKFIAECDPVFHETELMVGSARYGFAGRRDTVATCVGGKGKLTRSGRGLIDYKTSKDIYPESQFVQVAGYDLGGVEIGQDPTEWQAIVQLGEDGDYKIGYSTATHGDFLAYLHAFNARKAVVDRAKAAK